MTHHLHDPVPPAGAMRVGIGGWTFAPWRQDHCFYPEGLPHDQELAYASRHLSAIEINGTFYRLQQPATFAKWRAQTPEGFMFSLKAPRFVTHRRVLAEAGESVQRFLHSGLAELGDKLGPIVWQFAPHQAFDPTDFDAFLQMLPTHLQGLRLRHAVDVRHTSFESAAYLALARRHGVATVFTSSDDHPSFADLTGDFLYARVMRQQSTLRLGFEPAVLDTLAQCVRRWASGSEPQDLPRVEATPPALQTPRDVFLYFIGAAKERAPAAAMALLERLGP